MRLRNAPSRGKEAQPTTAGFGHSKYEIDPSELTIGAVLGSGNYGVISQVRVGFLPAKTCFYRTVAKTWLKPLYAGKIRPKQEMTRSNKNGFSKF
jgi:hypothetical protein